MANNSFNSFYDKKIIKKNFEGFAQSQKTKGFLGFTQDIKDSSGSSDIFIANFSLATIPTGWTNLSSTSSFRYPATPNPTSTPVLAIGGSLYSAHPGIQSQISFVTPTELLISYQTNQYAYGIMTIDITSPSENGIFDQTGGVSTNSIRATRKYSTDTLYNPSTGNQSNITQNNNSWYTLRVSYSPISGLTKYRTYSGYNNTASGSITSSLSNSGLILPQYRWSFDGDPYSYYTDYVYFDSLTIRPWDEIS
jgi:hypothetical protein